MGEECVLGATNHEKIKQLREDFDKETKDIKNDIREIKDNLLNRPTWTTTVIITILTAVSCSSITFAVTVLISSWQK